MSNDIPADHGAGCTCNLCLDILSVKQIVEKMSRIKTHRNACISLALDLVCHLINEGHFKDSDDLKMYEIGNLAKQWYEENKEFYGLD